MKANDFHAIWHALNEANVELVLARDLPPKEQVPRLHESLRQSRQATALLLSVLSECRANPAEDESFEMIS